MTTPGLFNGAHHFILSGGNFTEAHYASGSSNENEEKIPLLPPLRHSSALFTGNNNYLQKLEQFFQPTDNPIRKSFLLFGMGGIGKTQICLKFIEQTQDWFSDIFWIDSSSDSTIDLTLKQIAKAKGLGSGGSGGSLSSESALHWINGLRSNWLMVFDNAD
ncbi:hypothetical protein F5887DRAFT_510793, partial [Amanita rubescens]